MLEYRNKTFQIVSFSIVTIFLIVKAYLFWSCVSTANEFEESIFEMKEAGCSSDYANGMFKYGILFLIFKFRNYGESLLKSRSKNYTGLMFAIASLLLTFGFFLMELGKRNMYALRNKLF